MIRFKGMFTKPDGAVLIFVGVKIEHAVYLELADWSLQPIGAG